MGNCNMGAAHSSSDPATAAKSVVRVARALARAALPPFSELSPHRPPWSRRPPPSARRWCPLALAPTAPSAATPGTRRRCSPRRTPTCARATSRSAAARACRRRSRATARARSAPTARCGRGSRARARSWLHFARGGGLLRHPLLLPRAPRPISACASQVGEFVWQSWSQIADKVDAGACACRRRRFTGCKQALRPARRCWPRLLVIVRRPRAPPRSLPQWPLRWWR